VDPLLVMDEVDELQEDVGEEGSDGALPQSEEDAVVGGVELVADPVLEGLLVKKLSIMTMESPAKMEETKNITGMLPEYHSGWTFVGARRKRAPVRTGGAWRG